MQTLSLLLIAAFALFPFHAAASFLASGKVVIRAGATVLDPTNIAENDVITEITIGDQKLVNTHQPGDLTIVTEGNFETLRDLGTVDIESGDLEIQSSLIGSARIHVGDDSDTQFTDPSLGTCTVSFTTIETGWVLVDYGTATIQASNIPWLRISELGNAIVTGSTIGAIDMANAGGGSLFMQGGLLEGGAGDQMTGSVLIHSAELHSFNANLENGDIDIGLGGFTRTTYDAVLNLTLGAETTGVVTNITIAETDVTSPIGTVRGGDTDAGMQQASTWDVAGLLRIYAHAGESTQLRVSSASRVDAGTLSVYGDDGSLLATGEDTVVHVDGDLELGKLGAGPAIGAGTLTVQDGAHLSVDGTLVIHPLAVLNLEPGGTVRTTALNNLGTINENGGTLTIPEPGGAAAAALAALAWLAHGAARR
jgi:hypothetical protein